MTLLMNIILFSTANLSFNDGLVECLRPYRTIEASTLPASAMLPDDGIIRDGPPDFIKLNLNLRRTLPSVPGCNLLLHPNLFAFACWLEHCRCKYGEYTSSDVCGSSTHVKDRDKTGMIGVVQNQETSPHGNSPACKKSCTSVLH